MTFDYTVFGLRIRSALTLPDLAEAPGPGEPDVRIGLGPLPAGSPVEPGTHALGDGAVFVVDDIARFYIRGGSEILVEPAIGAADRNIRLYLLGSAFGLLLHQRGLLALHANAIEIGGKAVLFMGASGEGKSTLAAWFHDRGHRIIADDVCVIVFDHEGRPMAAPGMPRLRLWKDVLEAGGYDPADYERSYAGDESWDKFDVPLAPDLRIEHPVPVAAIYLLKRGGVGIVPVEGLNAADALFANTYRGAYVSTAGDPGAHFRACLTLVRHIPIFAVLRAWDLSLMNEEAAATLVHATAVVGRHLRAVPAQS